MGLLTSILILLISARLLGQLALRFGQPETVGEMLAGFILGPTLLNLIHPSAALSGVSELAVFLIVLSAGLEMKFADIAKGFKGKGLIFAGLGFVIPLGAGIVTGIFYELDVMRTVFLGLCLSVTALPVALRILESLKMLDTEIARYSISTAIINDLAALLALGVILSLPQQTTFGDVTRLVVMNGGKLIILALVILGMNSLITNLQRKGVPIQKFPEKIITLFGNEALFGIVVLFVLLFGSISEALGFHALIGSFFGALLLSNEIFMRSRKHELDRTISSISGGFLAPIFFAYIGLEFNMSEIRSVDFAIVVLIASISSKFLAGWLAGRIVGMDNRSSMAIGSVLNGRGVMELVIASIAFERGFIGQGFFSVLILMSIVTTILTPIMVQWFVPSARRAARR